MNEIYSGYNITLNKLINRAYKGKMLKIEGESKQETRSGKNRFNINGTILYGSSSQISNNGFILAEDSSNQFGVKFNAIPAGIYTISCNITKNTTNAETIIDIGTDSKNEIYIYIPAGKTGKFTERLTLNSTTTNTLSAYISTTDTGGTSIVLEDIQIEEGTVATSWEEYGASPSINYPSENKSVGDNINEFDSETVNSRYNVIQNDNEFITKSESNAITINADASSNPTYEKNLKAGDYTVSFDIISTIDITLSNFYLLTKTSDDTIQNIAVIKSVSLKANTKIRISGSGKLNADAIKYGFAGYFKPNFSSGTITISNIKLEKGTKATPYSPYRQGSIEIKQDNGLETTDTNYKSQTKALYTQKPFRAIGDVRDRFVKKNGIWYEEHNIARVIFDGTENIVLISTDTITCRFAINNIVNSKTGTKVLSNYFMCFDDMLLNESFNSIDREAIHIRGDNTGIGIRINKSSNITTADKFKSKLTELYNAGTPLYVDYVLATPELIPCTPGQSIILDQLENIQLYDGENHIYSVGEVRPLLELQKYYMMEDYDMYISTEGFFTIPGTDIKFKVNFMESSLPSMPEATESSVRAAGRDGDYVLNTTYEPIPFEIVCYTEDNLTITEKKEIEAKVNRFLNSIKNKTKRLAFERDDKFYNVKYNSLLTTTNYPAHLKFGIPLKSSESYAKDTFEKVIAGNNSEISDTVNPVGALITINGPATLPIISLNDYSIEYSTAILEGARLEIDTSKSTATHINSDGVRTNVMRYYNHQFPKIEAGENTLKVLSGVDDEYNVTVKWNDLKL